MCSILPWAGKLDARKGFEIINKKRPWKNAQFRSSSRKEKILTTGIHESILRIKI
jgi:hypothetical protein